jgi:hypothetical protein
MAEGLTVRRRTRRGTTRRRGARLLAAVTGAALVGSAMVGIGAPAAGAATGTVTDATFEWAVSDEANAASFNGQCNFWSAGQSDGTAGTYVATNGNATVVKLNAADQYVPISDYGSRCKDKLGDPVNFLGGVAAKRLGQKVRFTGGTGTLDPATGATTIQWTGTFTVNFYGTLVPFWITNPRLVVDTGGAGTITASMGGYASDQANPDVKVPLPATSGVVIARFAGLDTRNTTGFSATPSYAGVPYDVDPATGQSPQNRVNAGWGAWPAPFVDFQMATGLGSYWYSSGGSIDVRKPPTAVTVGFGTFHAPAGPTTTVTPGTDLDPSLPQSLLVAGTGFTGFAPAEQGVYTGLVSAAKWQPGQAPNPADFIGTTYTPKVALVGGALSTTVVVPAGAVTDPAATYGVATFCAHACSASNRAFDSFTPVDFVTPDPAQGRVGSGYDTVLPGFAGVAPYTWSLKSGSLPPGLTLDAATGRVSGTPTTEGRFKAVLTVTDAKAPKAARVNRTLAVAVAPRDLRVVTAALPAVDLRVPYSQQLVADGGVAPYRFKVTDGTKPQGIAVTGAGLVKGTSKTPGTHTFTVTVTDAFKFSATRTFTVAVAPAAVTVVIDQASLPHATVGQAYATTLTASGGTAGPYRFKRVSGTLPAKVKLGADGTIAGTPAKVGTSTFSVTATDRYGYVSAPVGLTVTVG